MYRAFLVLMTLFHIILEVTRSAVLDGEFPRVVQEVTTYCDPDVVGVFFLWMVVYNNSGVGNSVVCWNTFDGLMVEKEIGVCSGSTCSVVILCEAL